MIDLSDEPVLTSARPVRARFDRARARRRLPRRRLRLRRRQRSALATPRRRCSRIIGTGKRVGKTAVSADIARQLKAAGRDVVVLAMGRGGPAEPELIRGDEVALTTADLLALARQGKHASSDNYEDAVMSRVTTVGCRRCGGGMAGATFFSNVPEGAALADSLGKELLIAEGSGAAIPPVASDATMLVVGAGRGETLRARLLRPVPPRAGRPRRARVGRGARRQSPTTSRAIRAAIAEQRPELPVVATTFRPRPIEPVAGKRVFFATTAPAAIAARARASTSSAEHGCEVVGASAQPVGPRRGCARTWPRTPARYDVLLTELKAAAIDVVAAAGEEAGVPTVLCDNVPVAVDGSDLSERDRRALRSSRSIAGSARGRGVR